MPAGIRPHTADGLLLEKNLSVISIYCHFECVCIARQMLPRSIFSQLGRYGGNCSHVCTPLDSHACARTSCSPQRVHGDNEWMVRAWWSWRVLGGSEVSWMRLHSRGSLIRALYCGAGSALAPNERLVTLCVLNLLHISRTVNSLNLWRLLWGRWGQSGQTRTGFRPRKCFSCVTRTWQQCVSVCACACAISFLGSWNTRAEMLVAVETGWKYEWMGAWGEHAETQGPSRKLTDVPVGPDCSEFCHPPCTLPSPLLLSHTVARECLCICVCVYAGAV